MAVLQKHSLVSCFVFLDQRLGVHPGTGVKSWQSLNSTMYVYSTVDQRQGWTMLGQGSKAGSLSTPHCMSKSRPEARSLSRYVESTQKNTHWYSADVETSSRKFEILTEKVIIYRGCSQLMTPVFLGGLGNIWPLLLSSSISSLSSIMIEDLVFLLSAACRYMYTHSIYIYTLLFHTIAKRYNWLQTILRLCCNTWERG